MIVGEVDNDRDVRLNFAEERKNQRPWGRKPNRNTDKNRHHSIVKKKKKKKGNTIKDMVW